jgi:hypothetical protein
MFRYRLWQYEGEHHVGTVYSGHIFDRQNTIITNCIKTGILDLVKLCYKEIISDDYFFGKFHVPFLYGYTDIVQWMYEIKPKYCKKQFKLTFKMVNSFITNDDFKQHYMSVLKTIILSPIKYQQIIHSFVDICDDAELEIIDNIYDEIPIYTIQIISPEDKLWRQSLRCIWIKACIELSFNL